MTIREFAELHRHDMTAYRKKRGLPIPVRGLGDAVARVTDALHIPQCGGCKKRQQMLNKLVPFNRSESNG